MTDETYLARREEGIRYGEQLVTADSAVNVEPRPSRRSLAGTSLETSLSHKRADAIREALDAEVKRVLDSWAPTVHSGLFTRGRIQGLVQVHPDEEEQAVTELLADEAGAATRRDGPLYVAACDEETLVVLWSAAKGP